jgi:hypothetical protein
MTTHCSLALLVIVRRDGGQFPVVEFVVPRFTLTTRYSSRRRSFSRLRET